MKSYKQFISEDTSGTPDEYYKILSNIYDKQFAGMILTGDSQAEQFFGKKATIRTTGNIFVKYIDTPQGAGVLGFMSKSGKILKSDLPDMKLWFDKIQTALKQGKFVMTSINRFSKPYIERIMKSNPDIKKDEFHSFNHPEYGEWINVRLYI